MSAYDLILVYCELIVARMPIIESQKYVSLNHFFFFILKNVLR